MDFGGYPISWPHLVATTEETAHAVADLMAQVTDFSSPGLGSWDVEALMRHTTRALSTLGDNHAAAPAEGIPLDDAAAYFCAYLDARDADPDGVDAAVAERARSEAGDVAAEALANHVRTSADEILERVGAADPTTPVPTRMGALRLADYVRTRLAELVIHGLDLSAATGIPLDVSEPALCDTLDLLSTVAVRRGGGGDLIRLLTGRAATESSPIPVIR